MAEWVVALVLVWLGLWLVLPVVRSLAPSPSATFALVESALPELPEGVPPGAESVPLLILQKGLTIRVGMREGEVTAPAFSRYSAGPAIAVPGVLGERAILPLRSGPSRFWVVLDRTASGQERKVTAIYVR